MLNYQGNLSTAVATKGAVLCSFDNHFNVHVLSKMVMVVRVINC